MGDSANLAMLQWLGIKPEDYVDEENDVLLWPENIEAANFFIEFCSTQWRVGMGGATGLDYTAIIAALQYHECDKTMFDDLRTIERGALSAMAERRKKEENDRKK